MFKNYSKSFSYFLFGGVFSLIILFIYLFLTNTPFENLLYQYFLFPLSLGSERILSDPSAYVSLKDQISFKKLIMDFKYIHIFLFPIIFFTVKQFYNNNQNKLKIYKYLNEKKLDQAHIL